MTTYSNKKIIKPSLKAFPLTWFWIGWFSFLAYKAGDGSAILSVVIFTILPMLLIMLLATYGRSYVITENQIAKINHITGKKESAYMNSIGRLQIKPRAFGYGHMILTLAGGHKLKIKNIKLPSKTELDLFN